MAKLPMTTSRAKKAPAIGALKAAAIPPATPQPARVGSRLGGTLSNWPRTEPSEAPIWTMGPSRPTEPPEPIVRAEETDLARAVCQRNLPFPRATDSMTSGTPCPCVSRERKKATSPTAKPPSVGTRRMRYQGNSGSAWSGWSSEPRATPWTR